jgi:hypothetical protein
MNLGKILVSKFLLNLLVEILKVLPNSEIYLNLKIKTLLIFFFPMELAQPAAMAHSFPGCHLPHLTQQAACCVGAPPDFYLHRWKAPSSRVT